MIFRRDLTSSYRWIVGLARCPTKGCAVRYRNGPDRCCADHADPLPADLAELIEASRQLGQEQYEARQPWQAAADASTT